MDQCEEISSPPLTRAKHLLSRARDADGHRAQGFRRQNRHRPCSPGSLGRRRRARRRSNCSRPGFGMRLWPLCGEVRTPLLSAVGFTNATSSPFPSPSAPPAKPRLLLRRRSKPSCAGPYGKTPPESVYCLYLRPRKSPVCPKAHLVIFYFFSGSVSLSHRR